MTRGYQNHRRTAPREVQWHWQAACLGSNPDLFFPSGYTAEAEDTIRQAKAVCAGCPVRHPCLEEALRNNDFGIWGGTDDRDREIIRRQQRNATRRDQRAAQRSS